MRKLDFKYRVDNFCCGLLSVGDLVIVHVASGEKISTEQLFLRDLRQALVATGTTRAVIVVREPRQEEELAIIRGAFRDAATEIEWTSRTTHNDLIFIFSPALV